MNYFLEPYEKIKEIRKKYDITQKELAGEVYTQGYITALERGVKRLTDKNVVDIVDRFNDIFIEKKINVVLNIENIKKNRKELEEEFIDKIIEEIKVLRERKEIVRKFREVKLKVTQTSVENQIRVYEQFSEIIWEYEYWEEMKEVSAFLIMRRERDKDLKKFSEAFERLALACSMTIDYEYMKTFEENYVEKLKDLNKVSQEKIYFNMSLMYMETVESEKALYYLDILMKMDLVVVNEIDVYLTRAYALETLGRYEESKKASNYVIRKNNRNRNYLINAKQNITSAYMKEKNYKEVRKNYSFLKKELKKEKVLHLTEKYTSLGEIAVFIGKNNEAKKFYEIALDGALLEGYEEYREGYYIDSFNILFKIYKKRDKEKVLKYEGIFKKIYSKEYKKEASFAFMRYYLNNKLYKELGDFIDLYEKISKKD